MLSNARINETTQNQLDVFFASYGDPNPGNSTIDWVPIMIEGMTFSQSSKCSHLVSSIRFDILYSLVGSLGNPQAKLLGASLRSFENKLECDKTECFLDIVSSVMFTDISATSVSRYAQAPIIKVKLPQDFFYPFVSNGGKTPYNIRVILVTLLVSILK